jgi:AcrR family transcriptional regulator
MVSESGDCTRSLASTGSGGPGVTPAAAAGVSVQSVHKAFGNKPALLKSVSDVAIAGDDEPVPVPQRAALSRVRAEPDLAASCGRNGRWVAETLIAALLP